MTDTFGEAGISRSPLSGLEVNRFLAAGLRLPLWFSGLASTDLFISFVSLHYLPPLLLTL